MNGSLKCGQQNSVVEQRNVKTFLLDVPGDINVYKFWITSLYSENRNVLIHELHTVSQCLSSWDIKSFNIPKKLGYTRWRLPFSPFSPSQCALSARSACRFLFFLLSVLCVGDAWISACRFPIDDTETTASTESSEVEIKIETQYWKWCLFSQNTKWLFMTFSKDVQSRSWIPDRKFWICIWDWN